MRGLDSSIHDLSVSATSGPRPPGPLPIADGAAAPNPERRSLRRAQGPLGHPAVLLIIAASILFVAYALGYIPQFGSLLEAAVRSTQNAGSPALDPALYGVAGLAAFFVLFALLRSVDLLLNRFRKRSPLELRPVKPINAFLQEAAAGGIGVRVARESYHLLKPHYPNVMSVDLNDDLRSDLGLSDEEIRLLDTHLLARCDRREAPATPDSRNVTTVFDLLLKAETSTVLSGGRSSGSRERSTDAPAEVPKVVADGIPGIVPTFHSRNPTSAERKAIHAEALRAIESRSLRTSDPSMLHRRSSDYEGPRRRATDVDAAPAVFKGPYRRATDRVATRVGAPPSAERKAETKPEGLMRPDPLLVPPAV